LLFVGRFDKRKGGDVVLRAFTRLLAVNPDLTLVFVGPDRGVSGPDGTMTSFEEMRTMLFPGAAAARVDYRGRLPPEQIYGLRTQALVTLIASRWENQSYAALEAMLQGCPLISSDAGGQGEFVVHGVTGLLYPPESVEELVDRVQRLLDDPKGAAALGRRAREYALQHHSPAEVVDQTLGVYNAAIDLASRRGGL
jgi:glycosyltransferase involved in cell wall biosynthesis